MCLPIPMPAFGGSVGGAEGGPGRGACSRNRSNPFLAFQYGAPFSTGRHGTYRRSARVFQTMSGEPLPKCDIKLVGCDQIFVQTE